jgi:hypothetical protein
MQPSGPPPICDTHLHSPRDVRDPSEDPAVPPAYTVERPREAGIVKAAIVPGGGMRPSDEHCARLREPDAETRIPAAVIDPERTTRLRIRELYRMGYRRLKMIGVLRDPDTPDYFPVDAAAAQRLQQIAARGCSRPRNHSATCWCRDGDLWI